MLTLNISDYGIVRIGNTAIKYKSVPCRVNGVALDKYASPHINIQVQVTNKCNADCDFCIYHQDNLDDQFDIGKFIRGLEELHRHIDIPKITFTGGETSIEFDNIKECVKYINKHFIETLIKINTNGTRIEDFLRLNIWQLSLSRHSVNDEDNCKIFKNFRLPSNSDILNIINILKLRNKERKLHLSCNLIRGHVDSYERMKEYINFYGDMGIRDIGFISLMPVNQYAKDNVIDFSELGIKQNDELLFGRHCEYIKNDGVCHCECQVYHILSSNGTIVEAYNRFARDHSNCDETNIVYNINKWRQGFSGRILNIVD